jgi:O-antigen/teichoic acid export membrane protein
VTETPVGDDSVAKSSGIARNSALLLAASLIGNAGYFVSVLVVARVLGASGRGSMAFLIVTSLVVARIASVGVGEATTVFAAQRPAVRPALLTNMLLFTGAAGVVGGASIVLILAVADGARPAAIGHVELWALGFGIFASAVNVANWGFLLGIGKASTLAALNASTPWLYSFFLVVLWLGPGLTVGRAAVAWAAHAGLDAIVGLVLSARATGLGRPIVSLATQAIRFGLRAWIGTLSGFLNARADQVLMGFITTEAVLGVYAVAVNASETLLYLPGATGLALLPSIASVGRGQMVDTTLLVFRRLMLLTLATAVVAAGVGPALIPRLFGAPFSASVVPFLLLVPGAIGYAALAVFTNALAASSAPGRSSIASIVALAIGLTLDVVLIPDFGASGAAFAATVAFLIGGVAALLLFRRRNTFGLVLLVPTGPDVRALLRLARHATRRLWRGPA